MGIDGRPLVDLVARHQRFLLTTHAWPDGDAIGSQKALAAALRQRGKQVRVANPTGRSDRYNFLDPEHELRAFVPPGEELRDTEVLIVLDTGTWNQLGVMADFIRTLRAEKMVIDHHPTQDDLGARRLVDPTAEATGRLIYEAIEAFGAVVTPEVAIPLFVALATDTGWFRHGNVIPATFTLAAELVRAGARPSDLYRPLYEQNSPVRLRLMGAALCRVALAAGGRVAYSTIRRTDLADASPADAEELTNLTVTLAGADVSALFTELPDGSVKVSLRSRDGISVGALAEQFGGGGHRQAAGFTWSGPLEAIQARVLQAVEKALEESLTK